MDRHRGDRSGDRFGDGARRIPSRWSSDSPTHQHHRLPRGGGGGGEGFSGGGGNGGNSGGRYHPYRGSQDFPPPPMDGGGGGGGGFRGSGFGPPPTMGGPRRGFPGRGGSPDRGDTNKYAKLFIGSVPRTATEEDIRPVFEDHGDVIEVAFIKDRKTGEQQGCCFVKYASSAEADRAIRALHNQYTLPGGLGPIQVRYADGEKEHQGALEDKLFVASLNKQATAKEIEEIFSPYGHVEDVYIMRDSSRQSRGCGFVKFSNREMAMAALNGINGKFVMRGCDQPLVVRFADPKRSRPGEQRGGPAFGGPGFSPRSEAALVIRPTTNLDEPKRHKPDGWHPLSPEPHGASSQFGSHGLGSHLPTKGGSVTASSDNSGIYGPAGGLNNGSVPNLSMPPSSQGFNPLAAPVRPVPGQQMSSLQKPFMPPQNFPPPMKLQHSQQTPTSSAQNLSMQAPMQQLGQLQAPQSGSLNPFNQNHLSSQFPGLGGQGSTSQSLRLQNPSNAALQTPLGLQAQAVPAIANQQQFPVSNITQQLLQQPIQQFPQLPQMLLQQQAQALQSSVHSSQQAIIQLQQQLQLMQQQQQVAQAAKPQSAWTGSVSTSATPVSAAVSTSASVNPSPAAATPSITANASTATPLTCNWTEHTSPEGFNYYYNSMTHESKWEKPEEFAVFEQLQQKLQQQKLSMQQLPSTSDVQSNAQVKSTPQVSQSQQVQPQMMKHAQLHLLQPGLFQASGGVPHQSLQDVTYGQLQTAGSVIDPARVQQGIQAIQEWAWKNKPAGS